MLQHYQEKFIGCQKANETLKEASSVSQLAKENLDQKRAELAKQQAEYKELQEEAKRITSDNFLCFSSHISSST